MRHSLHMLAHNLIAHPIVGVLHFVADVALRRNHLDLSGWLCAAAFKVHEATLPADVA